MKSIERESVDDYGDDYGVRSWGRDGFPLRQDPCWARLGVAFVMRWPGGGVSGGRRCPWLLGNVDFLPTLLELAGVESPDNLQGRSFAAA